LLPIIPGFGPDSGGYPPEKENIMPFHTATLHVLWPALHWPVQRTVASKVHFAVKDLHFYSCTDAGL